MDKFLNTSHSTIHYRVYGEGIPVVFIHGFAEDSNIWERQVAFFKDRYRLIIPDIPGSGRSTVHSSSFTVNS